MGEAVKKPPPALLAPDRDPWSRQPWESASDHALMTRYRDANGTDRRLSLREFSRRTGTPASTLYGIARRGRWTDRLGAWWQHRDRTHDTEVKLRQDRQREELADLNHGLAMRFGKALQALPPAMLSGREQARAVVDFTRAHAAVTNPAGTTIAVSATAQAGAASVPPSAMFNPEDLTRMSGDERRDFLNRAIAEMQRRVHAGTVPPQLRGEADQ
ncbi:hypothetical protein P3T37_004341 [Kitasatospora sp. MAA4]|uniref:hypothetical protein n=1 Tax=Kitasatospora sp. MAA4 TaxID=3035093 RepID=UPI0024760DE4|nr:hypothetical protein [Kitasatospora sp. MAA4]MDH6134932.1 hypothetical protein [Kitasatospora sp. MAA4]